MVGPEIHDFALDDQLTVDFIQPMSWLLKCFVSSNWWSWKFKSRTGTRGAAVRDWLSNWGRGFSSHQAPLVRTAEEFQTERNGCSRLQPVFGFQVCRLIMNFYLESYFCYIDVVWFDCLLPLSLNICMFFKFRNFPISANFSHLLFKVIIVNPTRTASIAKNGTPSLVNKYIIGILSPSWLLSSICGIYDQNIMENPHGVYWKHKTWAKKPSFRKFFFYLIAYVFKRRTEKNLRKEGFFAQFLCSQSKYFPLLIIFADLCAPRSRISQSGEKRQVCANQLFTLTAHPPTTIVEASCWMMLIRIMVFIIHTHKSYNFPGK